MIQKIQLSSLQGDPLANFRNAKKDKRNKQKNLAIRITGLFVSQLEWGK